MTPADEGGPRTVEAEATRLKAALRASLEAPTTQRCETTQPADRASAQHAPGASDTCPVCRANHLAHHLGPDLMEEVGRGMAALGRTMQVLADGWRRHTADQHATRAEHDHRHDEEPS